jgi:methyl-accepting chemotaxis protein
VTLKDYEACAYKVLHDSTMGVYPTSGEANDALSIVAKKHVHKLQAETKQIADEAGAASRTAKQAILADAAAEKWLLGSVSAIVGALAILIVIVLSRLIAGGIAGLRSGIDRLATEHDLTLRFDAAGRNDLGIMGAALNNMMQSMASVFGNVRLVSDGLKKLADGVSVSAHQLKSATNTQSESVGRMAAAAEQLSVSVDQISDQAGTVAASAATTAGTVREGEASTTAVSHMIVDLSAALRQSSDRVHVLSEHAAKIEELIQAIKDIADQTNLLALNAAIEAARAGEQGRGFAVVADEVRKLSERAGRSTGEISALLTNIHAEIGDVSQGIGNALEKMQATEEQARCVRDAFGRILSVADSFTRVTGDISTATREQSQSTRSIASDIEHVAQMSEENGAVAGGLADAASEMNKQALVLSNRIAEFKFS